MAEASNDTPEPIVRTGIEERDYLLSRAAEHRACALRSEASEAKAVHLALAQLYEDRAAASDVVETDQPSTQEYQERSS